LATGRRIVGLAGSPAAAAASSKGGAISGTAMLMMA
jgi:hypothetical protein